MPCNFDFTEPSVDAAEKKLRAHLHLTAATLPDSEIPYKTTKSGKKLTVQHGTTWYEEHDTTLYTPLKVLTDTIKEGEPGHVRHRNALRLAKRMMKHPKFGTTAQIELLLPVGQNAMREFVTILLTKQQYLWVAAALNDHYLAVAVKHHYNSLSASERVLNSAEFVQRQRQEAEAFFNDGVKEQSPEQAEQVVSCIEQLDKLIAAQDESFEEYQANNAESIAELTAYINALSANSTELELKDKYTHLAEERVKFAVNLQAALHRLVDSDDVQLNYTQADIDKLEQHCIRANAALEYLQDTATLLKDKTMMDKYRLSNNSKFKIFRGLYAFSTLYNASSAQIFYDEKITQACVPNICLTQPHAVTFGLTDLIYDIMGKPIARAKLEELYCTEYSVTKEQAARIAQVIGMQMSKIRGFPKFASGAVVIAPEVHKNSTPLFWDVCVMWR